MLTEEQMQANAEELAEPFSKISLRILQDIGETLRKTGDLTPAQAKKLQQLFTYGADVEQMTKQLARAAGTELEAIRKLYERVAKEEQGWSKPFYDAAGVSQIPFRENDLLRDMVKAAVSAAKGNLKNMSRTTTVGIRTRDGFQPLGQFYKRTVNEAITSVAAGVEDYNSVIRRSVREMGSSGLRVQYESGYTRRLDSAIRQNILDGVSYIAQESARIAGEEFGADGVELSAHSPCAPDHLPYQGKQYSQKEYDELQTSLERPIGEWNCRHIAYPVLLGVSEPANSREELREMAEQSNRKIEIDGQEYTRYECSQLQRKLETQLRYAREEKAVYQAAGLDDLTRNATEKIRLLGNKYHEVSRKAGLPTRAERMRVYGKKETKQEDADFLNFSKGLLNAATGKTSDKEVTFKNSLSSVKDDTVRTLLSKTLENTQIKTSLKRNSYHSAGTIYLADSATNSTVAHELFHKIDYDNNISESGYLTSSIKMDYQRLRNIADGYGGGIEDVLYSKYPEAFMKKKHGEIVFKEDYRGVSDILNGMSFGEIKLGYRHKDDYWKRPFTIEKETWAQCGRILYSENDAVIEVLEFICPETYQKVLKKIKELK